MNRVDVLVVGGGPAGSTTALRLARLGYQVTLFDRAAFPRSKACGDCISPRANVLLDELGLLTEVERLPHARLAGWRIYAHNGSSFSADFADCTRDHRLGRGLAVERFQLDSILLNAARAAGVDVREHASVTAVHHEAGRVSGVTARSARGHQRSEARLVIGADGLRSVMRRRLGLAGRAPRLRKIAVTAHVDGITELGEHGEMHLAEGSCLGIAPIQGTTSRVNLTLVVDAGRFGRAMKGKSRTELWRHIERFPAARERISRHALNDTELLAAGPFDWPTRGMVVPGAALVGDAAGYYDPFTGQGIYQALHGAKLLSAAADRSLRCNTDEPMRAYERTLRGELGSARAVQKAIEYVCARPAAACAAIGALRHAPRAARQLIAVTGDLERPITLLSPRVLVSVLAACITRRS